jgi:Co/Zn/Cd efflux system component
LAADALVSAGVMVAGLVIIYMNWIILDIWRRCIEVFCG